MTEPPWDELDPGIRKTVRVLWDCGFLPTDSGDGSKAVQVDGALAVPHVFMACDPRIMIAESRRLLEHVDTVGFVGPAAGPRVRACYLPDGDVAVLELYGRLM